MIIIIFFFFGIFVYALSNIKALFLLKHVIFYSASWVFATNVAMVTKCPYTDHVAVFTDEKQCQCTVLRF